MNPRPSAAAILELARAQLKLGAAVARALLNLREEPPNVSKSPTAKQIERAATSIKRDLLKQKDVGLASLLRTNFTDTEIRDIARAALEAAADQSDESTRRLQDRNSWPHQVPNWKHLRPLLFKF